MYILILFQYPDFLNTWLFQVDQIYNWKISYYTAGVSLSYFINSPDIEDPIEIEENDFNKDSLLAHDELFSKLQNSDLIQNEGLYYSEENFISEMNKVSLKPETKVIEDLGCCYLILATDRNRNEINELLNNIGNTLDHVDLKIEKWTNPNSENIYHRLRTTCFNGPAETIKIKSELYKVLNKKTISMLKLSHFVSKQEIKI